MSDIEQPYTPSLNEARGVYAATGFRDQFRVGGPHQGIVQWRAEFDRMIEAVRAEEREKAARVAEKEIPEMGPHILETDFRQGKVAAASYIAARIRTQGSAT